MYVLRKSFGQWSAGTPVRITDGIFFDIDDTDIPDTLVTKRRTRTLYVPTGPNSRARRKLRRESATRNEAE